MTGDHHGRTAGRATLLVTATDEILGTHKRSPVGAGGRAFTHVSMTDQLGRLVVTGAQEGLIREHTDVHGSVVVGDIEKEFRDAGEALCRPSRS